MQARAGKREQSRRNVEKIALTMFAQRGFDSVTVEEICAEARIAPATFYRYFGSKESLVFFYEEGFMVAAREIGASVDPQLPTAEQLRHIVRRCTHFFEEQREVLALRDQIVLPNAALLQRTFAVERKFETTLAEALASRRQESEPATAAPLDAAACLVVLRLGLRAWRRQSDYSLQHHTDDTFEALRARLS